MSRAIKFPYSTFSHLAEDDSEATATHIQSKNSLESYSHNLADKYTPRLLDSRILSLPQQPFVTLARRRRAIRFYVSMFHNHNILIHFRCENVFQITHNYFNSGYCAFILFTVK